MRIWQSLYAMATQWLGENPTRQVTILCLLAVVGFVIVCIRFGKPGIEQVSLFETRELTRDEIGLMQVTFGKAGLNEYEIVEDQVHVPRIDRSSYLKALADHGGIPSDLVKYNQSGAKFDMFMSRAQQKQQMLQQKRQRIRDMVMQMKFVQKAMVEYDEAKGLTPFADLQRTAILTIKPVGDRALEDSEVNAVRETVRGAVAGLKANEIVITDINANRSYSGVSQQQENTMQPVALAKIREEGEYENKIRSALSAYHGARVNVEVAIDPVIHRRLDETRVDGDSVVISKTVQRETSRRSPTAKPTGTKANFMLAGTNGEANVQTWAAPSQLQREVESTESMASGKIETTETAGLTVKSVSVSIGIPERCVRFFADRRFPDVTADKQHERQSLDAAFQQIREDIESKVAPLIPITRQTGLRPNQLVVTIDPEIPFGENPGLSTQNKVSSTRFSILDYWQSIALLVVGFAVVVFLRGAASGRSLAPDEAQMLSMNSASVDSTSFIVNGFEEPIAEHSKASQNAAPIELAKDDDLEIPADRPASVNFTATKSDSNQFVVDVLKSQLDQWCHDNPDAAAATIRQWLEKAG